MLKTILYLIGLVLIKSIQSVIYIDLKYNYISEGVYVHYGKFGDRGEYRMFLGEENPLERVNFGSVKLFPPKNVNRSMYQLIVETYEINRRRFAIIQLFPTREAYKTPNNRIFYELGENTFIEMDLFCFLKDVYYPIELSIDMGPRIRHPYISKSVSDFDSHKVMTYKIVESFNDFKLDGNEAPKYKFGYVYDSSKVISVGYSKLKYFNDSCDRIIVYFRMEAERIDLKGDMLHLVYEKRYILYGKVWYMVKRPDYSLCDPSIYEAIKIYDRIHKERQIFKLLTVDIDGRLDPSMYGIEKTEGTLGEYKYTLYEVKAEFRNRFIIKSVIDMSTDNMLVFVVKDGTIHSSVEVFKNQEKIFVFVTSQLRIGLITFREIEIFEREITSRDNYTKILEPAKTQMIMTFVAMYPIKIKVNVNEEPTSIYTRLHFIGPAMSMFYYIMRDVDYKGTELEKKYIFGTVVEKSPYEVGNVPYDWFKNEIRVIRKDIGARKFLIRNTMTGIPPDPAGYEFFIPHQGE